MEHTLNKKSWHYFLARIGNDYEHIHSTSICSYTCKVIWGAAITLIGFIALLAFGFWIGTSIMDIWMFLFYGETLGAAAFWFLITLGGIICIFLLAAADVTLQMNRDSLMSKDNTTFFAKAYRAYKDKMCFKITIE